MPLISESAETAFPSPDSSLFCSSFSSIPNHPPSARGCRSSWQFATAWRAPNISQLELLPSVAQHPKAKRSVSQTRHQCPFVLWVNVISLVARSRPSTRPHLQWTKLTLCRELEAAKWIPEPRLEEIKTESSLGNPAKRMITQWFLSVSLLQ